MIKLSLPSKILIITATFFTAVLVGTSLITSRSVANYTPPKEVKLDAEKLWQITNDWRLSEGRKPFIRDQRLCDIANGRVNDGLDSHKGLLERYSAYPYVISENLGIDISEQEMLRGWLLSTPHATALRASYKYSCIATKDNFAVQIFSNL